MNKWIPTAALGTLLIWLLSALIQGPLMEQSLAKHSKAALNAPQHRGAFSDIEVKFSGQEATLTGNVGSQALRDKARDIVTHDVRTTGEWGESYNPVTRVIDQMKTDTKWLDEHPQQHLIASLKGDRIELSGWLKTKVEDDELIKAIQTKNGNLKTDSITNLRDGLRPGGDWAGTIQTVPDLRTAEGVAKNGALAFSSVDGKWTLLPGTTTDAQAAEAAAAAHLDADPIQAALGHLRGWAARKAEEERIEKLPRAYAGVAVLPNRLHIYGHVHNFEDSVLLVDHIKKTLPGIPVEEHITIDNNVRPKSDWETPLKDVTQKQGPFGFSMTANGKAVLWDTKGGEEGLKKALSAALPANYDSYGDLYAAYDKWAKDKAAADKAALEAAEKAKKDAEAAKMAAEKAAAEKAAKDAEAAKMAAATPPPAEPATPALPGHVGWTLFNNKMSLFGLVSSDAVKTQSVDAAKAAFPTATINADGLKVSATSSSPAGAKIEYAKPTDATKPAVGMTQIGGAAKVYNLDVFDSEIERDFSAITFPQGMIGTALGDFRASLVSNKLLQQDEPYVSVIASGNALTVVGEVGSEAAKKAILDSVKAANPGHTITDSLAVTPLVTEVSDTKQTSESAPKFELGKGGVAVVTPGQKWRTAVVHSIRFKTGSNRSKDFERALYQVRRVLKLNPTAQFEIAGHTDNVGNEAANIKLSEDRAKNVADGFATGGVNRSILTTRGAGPKEPVADPNTDAGRALNRRVDVLLK